MSINIMWGGKTIMKNSPCTPGRHQYPSWNFNTLLAPFLLLYNILLPPKEGRREQSFASSSLPINSGTDIANQYFYGVHWFWFRFLFDDYSSFFGNLWSFFFRWKFPTSSILHRAYSLKQRIRILLNEINVIFVMFESTLQHTIRCIALLLFSIFSSFM